MNTTTRSDDQSTSKDEQGGRSDNHNGSGCGSRSEKNGRHGGKNDANDERERERNARSLTQMWNWTSPYDKLVASGPLPLMGQHSARNGADNRRLPRVQTGRECARERSNTRVLVRLG